MGTEPRSSRCSSDSIADPVKFIYGSFEELKCFVRWLEGGRGDGRVGSTGSCIYTGAEWIPQLVPEILCLLDPEPEGSRDLVPANLSEKVEAAGSYSARSRASDIGVSNPRVYYTYFAHSLQFRPQV